MWNVVNVEWKSTLQMKRNRWATLNQRPMLLQYSPSAMKRYRITLHNTLTYGLGVPVKTIKLRWEKACPYYRSFIRAHDAITVPMYRWLVDIRSLRQRNMIQSNRVRCHSYIHHNKSSNLRYQIIIAALSESESFKLIISIIEIKSFHSQKRRKK